MKKLYLTWILFCIAFSGIVFCSVPKIYVSFHWHMHQPIYWPYESITQTMNNPDCSDAVVTYLTWPDRIGAYTHYPVDTIKNNMNLPHMGAQVSFSGSLIENINDLAAAGIGYGTDWSVYYRTARDWKTALGNPRLDLVGFGYHHPLMPLIDYVDIRRAIQDHRKILTETFGGTYSKGIFPPENAFSVRMIPALVDEGFQWVLVDNIHFDRANQGYPWTASQVMIPPNPADQRNAPQPNYISLSCQQNTCNAVSPGFGFRPHYSEYVDPRTGKAVTPDGNPARIIVVPTERSLGYDDSYGDRSPIPRLVELEKYNNDPAHPFLIVLAHDGDNAGASGSRYYLETCGWIQQNPERYEVTTIQDYLQMYPVDQGDVIHVEDGAWTGADIGDMEFSKWNGDPYYKGNVDHDKGYSHDRNSWAVITAAKNRLLTANSINSGDEDVKKAWKEFMVGETSCYWYWDGTYEWDLKPTIACNNAVRYSDKLLVGKYPDTVGPTVFIPQREPYNPGGKEWEKRASKVRNAWFSNYEICGIDSRSMPSDFTVWSLVYDASGVKEVVLEYRTSSSRSITAQNLVYAGGTWNSVPMHSKKIPDMYSSIAASRYKAEQYSAKINGLKETMVDYYVKATDMKGNQTLSPIQHVWVGKPYVKPQLYTPVTPSSADVLTVFSDTPAILHWGINDWTLPPAGIWPPKTTEWNDGKAVETEMRGPDAQGKYTVRIGPFQEIEDMRSLEFVFHYPDDTWGKDQSVTFSDPDANNRVRIIKSQRGSKNGNTFASSLLRLDSAARRAFYSEHFEVSRDDTLAARKEWKRVSEEFLKQMAEHVDSGSFKELDLLIKYGRKNRFLDKQLNRVFRNIELKLGEDLMNRDEQRNEYLKLIRKREEP